MITSLLAAMCPAPTISDNGMFPCEPCPSNTYWINATTCKDCPSGKVTNGPTGARTEAGCLGE